MRKTILGICAAFVFACSGEGQLAVHERETDPNTADIDALTVYLPGEDPDVVQADTEEMLASLPVYENVVPQLYDGPEFDSPRAQPGDVEKTSMTMLQGWSVRGNLHFEDGLHSSGEVGADHCSAAGLHCDEQWHLQANDIYIDTYTDFFGTEASGGDFMGACGSYMQGTQFFPCIQRYASQQTGGHSFKWKLLDANCGDATQKGHIRAGIIQGLSNFANASNPGTGVTFSETAGSDWNYAFSCGSGVYVPNVAAALAWTQPSGNLALRFGAPRKDGLPVDWIDECETPGLPGIINHRPGNPTKSKQAWDMTYSYSRSEIVFEDARIFGYYASCMTTAAQLRRGIANILMHEFGHDWGYQHSTGYNDAIFNALSPTVDCVADRDFVKQLHPFIRYGIADQDLFVTPGPTDEVWDNDISCFDESGWAYEATGLGANPQP